MKVPQLAPPGASTGVGQYGEWFTVKLAGTILPGRWEVVQGSVRLKLDPKRKAGVDGGNPVYHGLNAQPFELEGEQINDDERQAVADLFAQIVPQPGQSQNQYPLQLQAPHVALFGFPIFVKVIGCSAFRRLDNCRTKVTLFLDHWLPASANAPSATNQPRRAIRNNRNRPGKAPAGPTPPEQQPGAFGPPAKLTS